MKLIHSSDFLITLSKSVDEKVRAAKPSIQTVIYQHPVFRFKRIADTMDLPEKFILFIGRIREYKGLGQLIQAFSKLRTPEIALVIAGEGKFEYEMDQGITLINRWLEEPEIAELISRSHLVVFPYVEASQSGLIPYCISENKKIVITAQPGLLEQAASYKNSYVVLKSSVDALTKSISTAI